MEHSMRLRARLVVLIGPIAAGKSTVARKFIDQLVSDGFTAARIEVDEMAAMIQAQCGGRSGTDFLSAGGERIDDPTSSTPGPAIRLMTLRTRWAGVVGRLATPPRSVVGRVEPARDLATGRPDRTSACVRNGNRKH
jgi:hypothetical protein